MRRRAMRDADPVRPAQPCLRVSAPVSGRRMDGAMRRDAPRRVIAGLRSPGAGGIPNGQAGGAGHAHTQTHTGHTPGRHARAQARAHTRARPGAHAHKHSGAQAGPARGLSPALTHAGPTDRRTDTWALASWLARLARLACLACLPRWLVDARGATGSGGSKGQDKQNGAPHRPRASAPGPLCRTCRTGGSLSRAHARGRKLT